MECRSRIHFAASRNTCGAITAGTTFRHDPIPVCTFELRWLEGVPFYECLACGSCGCPSFDYTEGKMLPTEVFAHLQLHAELCAKLER
jgi:hypothetical protein